MRQLTALSVVALLWFGSAPTHAVDLNRGQALYEIRCIECHDVSVHGRTSRVAKNYEEIRSWVVRWNNSLGGLWEGDDIEEVTLYLNNRYYKYPCTGLQC
jgi:mono/diheme cytochrome c family protein